MRRESYSNRFATALEGVDIDNPGTALDRSGHPNPVPRIVGKIRRRHPVEVDDVEFLRANTDRVDQDHRARPVHHVAAGAERFLQGRGRAGDGLRRRGERRDQGSVRRRRRHRPDRRALYAGAAREGAPIRHCGLESRAGRASPAPPPFISASAMPQSFTRDPSGYSFLPELAKSPAASRCRSRRRSPTSIARCCESLPARPSCSASSTCPT